MKLNKNEIIASGIVNVLMDINGLTVDDKYEILNIICREIHLPQEKTTLSSRTINELNRKYDEQVRSYNEYLREKREQIYILPET